MCGKINMLPLLSANRGKEVSTVAIATFISSFLISVLAGIAANCVYDAVRKWLNGRKK